MAHQSRKGTNAHDQPRHVQQRQHQQVPELPPGEQRAAGAERLRPQPPPAEREAAHGAAARRRRRARRRVARAAAIGVLAVMGFGLHLLTTLVDHSLSLSSVFTVSVCLWVRREKV